MAAVARDFLILDVVAIEKVPRVVEGVDAVLVEWSCPGRANT